MKDDLMDAKSANKLSGNNLNTVIEATMIRVAASIKKASGEGRFETDLSGVVPSRLVGNIKKILEDKGYNVTVSRSPNDGTLIKAEW